MPGDGRRLAGHALHQVAVAAKGPDPVAEDGIARPVEMLFEPALGHGHADAVGRALTERPGGGLDTRGDAVFRMPGADPVQLAEALDVVEADRRPAQHLAVPVSPLDPGQVDQAVEQHRGVAAGQYEAVAVGPKRRLGIVAVEAGPQGVGHRRQAHRRPGVAGIGLLHRIDGQGADGVDGELVDIGGRGVWGVSSLGRSHDHVLPGSAAAEASNWEVRRRRAQTRDTPAPPRDATADCGRRFLAWRAFDG